MKTLLTLQLTIFLLVAIGFLMKKIHMKLLVLLKLILWKINYQVNLH